MRYLHYVTNEDETFETQYSQSDKPKISMECLAKIKKANYSIQDRESLEVFCIMENGMPL